MLRSLESIRVEPQALGLQSNLKDEGTNPADRQREDSFGEWWNWGLK